MNDSCESRNAAGRTHTSLRRETRVAFLPQVHPDLGPSSIVRTHLRSYGGRASYRLLGLRGPHSCTGSPTRTRRGPPPRPSTSLYAAGGWMWEPPHSSLSGRSAKSATTRRALGSRHRSL